MSIYIPEEFKMSDKSELAPATTSTCCTPNLGSAMSRDDAQRAARLLKAVADPTRLQLLSLIASSGEACACDLNGPVGLSQPTVSHHLKVLTEAGLVTREQRGTWAWFSIVDDRKVELSNLLDLVSGRQVAQSTGPA